VGVIRKSLMVGTGGIVSGSSKKQRVAKQTLQASQAAARVANQQLAAARREEKFRYETDPAYRAFVDKERAEAAAALAERQRVAAAQRRSFGVFLGKVFAVPALALTIALFAVLVWAPQLAFRRRNPWSRTGLLHALSATVHWE
jgi:hypothetical protein